MNQRDSQRLKQQMSQEELLKTQVLNLKDVEEAVRFEKRTSKKPAIVVASFGIFAILLGTSFPVLQSMTAKKDPAENIEHKVEKKKVLNTESDLNCTYTALNNPDGTDTILNIKLTFINEKLTQVAKVYTINPTVGNPLGTNSVQSYINGYQPFLAHTITGYQMSVTPVGEGLMVTSNVDLTTFDPVSLPELHKSNLATNVEYSINTDKTAIYNDLASKNFTCQ